MKYIRTKDSIITQYDTVRVSDIVRKADTIEELCDEFVFIKTGKHKPFIYTIHFEDIKKYANEKEYTVFGAIWTDKGLIYVAKINEKGELELL